jgi:hypothetical protein
MTKILRIDLDPIVWRLTDEQAEALHAAATGPGDPVAVDVFAPWSGRLLVAPRAIGALAFLASATAGGGWVPSDVDVPTTRIYVPGAAPAPDQQLGYPLGEHTDLAALELSLLAALGDGTTVSVAVPSLPVPSRLVLNGAVLSHVVLRRARP